MIIWVWEEGVYPSSMNSHDSSHAKADNSNRGEMMKPNMQWENHCIIRGSSSNLRGHQQHQQHSSNKGDKEDFKHSKDKGLE